MNELTTIQTQIETDYDEHIERIQTAVQQPSISVEYEGLDEIASLMCSYLEELGCQEAKLIETDGAPGVWGYYDAGAEKTIINYGMLDTRPVGDESEWTYGPFDGTIDKHEEFDSVLYGRGSVKVKGAFVAWLNSLMSMKAALGELPVNIMFLLEAEEINGSPYYYDMVDQYFDRLTDADACLCPLAGQNSNGSVSASLGYKAALYFTLTASGTEWGRGPQGGSIHAMSNVVVDSPVWRLIDALNCLTAECGTKITIEDYYDQYNPPTEKEREEIKSFVASLGGDDDLWKSLPGLGRGDAEITKLKDDLHTDVEEAFIKYFYSPESFNIQGLYSGYLGPGTNSKPFTLPGEATAKFDLRMPRGFDPDVTLTQIREHLDSNGFDDIVLDVSGKHPASTTDRESILVTSTQNVFNRHGVDFTLWPYSAGGVPWSAIGNMFNVPVLYGVGLGYGGNYEGADEFLVLEGNNTVSGLIGCELSHAELLLEYANA